MGNIISLQAAEWDVGTSVTSLDSVTLETVLTYEYDSQNQLTRENNLYLEETIVYTYDDGENITDKRCMNTQRTSR